MTTLATVTTLPTSGPSERCAKHIKKLGLTPYAIYEDLATPGVKALVQEALKSNAGVYVIINLVNGNTYVGSAITNRMANRFHKHLFGLSGSIRVANAVRMYGLANFAFVVAKVMPDVVTQEDNRALLDMEDSFIQLLLPEYNIAEQAGNTFGVLHTEETKAMMRLNYSKERREMVGAINRGKTLSTEEKEKIREAALGRVLSPESRALVSANSAKAYY
ncbi:hypothetical protein HK100_001973 [Physocladia obscura]|uniref:GIY-YIG domain-containing protein n=1 Tax=Physocladia obscura TaxID=109957 RepID=A0AAD5XE58_9FUNG|nr:hypothetical protein HK100_001973 [Physocladia obscura]